MFLFYKNSIEILVRTGVDVNHDNRRWSPLKWACHHGHAVIANCLLRCGARVDKKWKGPHSEQACRVKAQVIESMGGMEGVAKAHLEWLACAPGRKTKSAGKVK